ncbi:hypothetical protein [Profundibacter sp.]
MKELGSLSLPSWQTVADPLIESRQDKLVTGPKGRRVTVFELMPKGQNDNNWRKRHWMVTFENVTKTTKAIMNSNLRTFGKECATDVHFSEHNSPRGARLFVMFCGRLKAQSLGQVSMIWLGKSGPTLVRVSEEWRGVPYDNSNPNTFFWRKADLRRAVQLLGTTRLK